MQVGHRARVRRDSFRFSDHLLCWMCQLQQAKPNAGGSLTNGGLFKIESMLKGCNSTATARLSAAKVHRAPGRLANPAPWTPARSYVLTAFATPSRFRRRTAPWSIV